MALRARALIALAVPRFESHGLSEGVDVLERARAEAQAAGAIELVVLAQVQEAGLQARSGRWAQSVRAIDDVDRDLEVLSDRERAVAYLNRGLAKQYLADFSGSLADLELAHEVAARCGARDIAQMARHNQGCLALLKGDIPAALALMTQGLATESEMALAATLLDLGRAYIEAGLLEEARTQLWRGLHLATGDRLNHTRGELLIALAREAVIAAEPGNAATYAREAADIFDRFSAVAWRQQAQVMGAQASLLSGDLEGFAQLATAVRRHRSESPALRHDAALVATEEALQTGDLVTADIRLREARQAGRVVLTARLHRDLLDATIGHRFGQADRRRRALHRASTRLVKASASYSGMDSRTALALHGWRLAQLDLDVALESGRPGSVYAATERWRSLSSRLPRLQPIADDRLRDLAAELRHVHAQLDDLDDISDDGELRTDAARLERMIAQRERELSGTGARDGVTSPLSYAAARRALADADAGAAAFFTHRGRLCAISMEDGRSRIHELANEADVRSLSRRLTADLRVLSHAPPALRPVVEASIAREVARLDALLAPALAPGRTAAIIVPSRVLPSVPWRMLPSLTGRSAVITPSLSTWGRPCEPGTGSMSAISGPGVPRAEAEVRAVCAQWPGGRAFVADEATTGRLNAALAESEVLHVAAHGVHHDESPLFSFVQLADGPAFAYEFQQVRIAAQHVVLSSCDAGQSHFRVGDESLGLTASLLGCGVRSVVAAVAPVLDSSAAPLMAAYHAELARGADAATALQTASQGIPDAGLFAVYGANWQCPTQMKSAGSR